MSDRPVIGVAALARPTFDVLYAEQMAADAFAVLDTLPASVVGSRDLLFDAEATQQAIASLRQQSLDLMLVLQVTFTDASMTVSLAEQVTAPLALWSFPEPRTGGRLRLNALCGINLAAHALGRIDRAYSYLHCAPNDAAAVTTALTEILAGRSKPAPITAEAPLYSDAPSNVGARAEAVRNRLAEARLGLLGEHPLGFDTCAYDPDELRALTGTRVEPIELPKLFEAAREVSDETAVATRRRVAESLDGLADLEAEPLDRSLRLYTALRQITDERQLSGLAIRCWPEMFTDYGCAACGPMAMLNDEMIPCACEADVYGNVTTLMLQWAADAPALMADLVDIDRSDNSGVFWHCGLAPLAMADPEFKPRAGIHSNRQKPLLNEFPLKPGRITIARLSQAKSRKRLVLAGGEMIRAPMSFSGTSGVVRFDRSAGEVLDRVIAEGLEHHYAFAYGEHRPVLRALAAQLSLETLELA